MAKPELRDHRKFLKLCRLLQAPVPHVLGYLDCLWNRGYQTGNPFIGDADDVEAAAMYPGDAGTFTRAAVAAGFLDIDERGQYVIHDLWDHAPKYAKARIERAGFKPKSSQKRQDRDENGRIVPGVVTEVASTFHKCGHDRPQVLPCTAPPNPKPNPKPKPNSEIHSDATASGREADPSKPKRSRKPKAEAKPREPWPTYDAVKAVTGCDGSHVAAVARKLDAEDPPYTPSEILSFLDRLTEICPHILIDGKPRLPSVGEVEKYYPRLRMTAPALPEQAAKQPPKSFAEVRVEKAVSLLDQAKQQALEREARQAIAGQSQPAIVAREGTDHAA